MIVITIDPDKVNATAAAAIATLLNAGAQTAKTSTVTPDETQRIVEQALAQYPKKSCRAIAAILTEQGHKISHVTVWRAKQQQQ